MAADNKEATSNEKAGAEARALASAPLLGSDITDEEEAVLKDKPLAAVSNPEEAITTGVVAADTPK